jgi:integrase
MALIKLEYVQTILSRGHRYYYFRRNGVRTRLPGLPGSTEFNEAYASALAGSGPARIGAERNPHGSLAALIGLYAETGHFQALAPRTRQQRFAILQRIRAEFGTKPVAMLQRKHVIALLANRSPFVQRHWIKALKPAMEFAVEIEWIKENPLRDIKVKLPRSDGFTPWTAAEIEAYRRRHPLGSMARLALELAFGTVMRGGDLIQIGPANVWNGKLVRRTAKTGALLTLPILPELREALDAMPPAPPGATTFLTNSRGKPFRTASWCATFAAWATEAGLPAEYRAHGLRKAGLVRLAQSGASAHILQSWSGHASLAILGKYTKRVEQAKLAEDGAAILGTKVGKQERPDWQTLRKSQ